MLSFHEISTFSTVLSENEESQQETAETQIRSEEDTLMDCLAACIVNGGTRRAYEKWLKAEKKIKLPSPQVNQLTTLQNEISDAYNSEVNLLSSGESLTPHTQLTINEVEEKQSLIGSALFSRYFNNAKAFTETEITPSIVMECILKALEEQFNSIHLQDDIIDLETNYSGDIHIPYGDDILLRDVLASQYAKSAFTPVFEEIAPLEILHSSTQMEEATKKSRSKMPRVNIERRAIDQKCKLQLLSNHLPLRKPVPIEDTKVYYSELLYFAQHTLNLSFTDEQIDRIRQAGMFETMMESAFTDVALPTFLVEDVKEKGGLKKIKGWNIANKFRYTEKVSAEVMAQIIAYYDAKRKDTYHVLCQYYEPTDKLLVMFFEATAQGRHGVLRDSTKNNHRSTLLPCLKDFSSWFEKQTLKKNEDLIEEVEGTSGDNSDSGMNPEEEQIPYEIFPKDVRSLNSTVEGIYPADHSTILRKSMGHYSWLVVNKDNHVLCLQPNIRLNENFSNKENKAIFAADLNDIHSKTRVSVTQGKEMPNKPDKLGTVKLSVTGHNGLVVTASSDGSIKMEYVAVGKVNEFDGNEQKQEYHGIPPAAIEEHSRVVKGDGTVTRYLKDESMEVLYADGTIVHYKKNKTETKFIPTIYNIDKGEKSICPPYSISLDSFKTGMDQSKKKSSLFQKDSCLEKTEAEETLISDHNDDDTINTGEIEVVSKSGRSSTTIDEDMEETSEVKSSLEENSTGEVREAKSTDDIRSTVKYEEDLSSSAISSEKLSILEREDPFTNSKVFFNTETQAENKSGTCKIIFQLSSKTTLSVVQHYDGTVIRQFDTIVGINQATMKADIETKILIQAPGFPTIEVDQNIDSAATKHANGEQIPIKKGGDRVRSSIVFPDKSVIAIRYDTRVTSKINGRIILTRADGSKIIAADSQEVAFKYRPTIKYKVNSPREVMEDEDEIGIYLFDLRNGFLRLVDEDQNTFQVFVNSTENKKKKENHISASSDNNDHQDIQIELAGSTPGIQARPVIEDAIIPRVFVLNREGDATEWLCEEQVQDFSLYISHIANKVEIKEELCYHDTDYTFTEEKNIIYHITFDSVDNFLSAPEWKIEIPPLVKMWYAENNEKSKIVCIDSANSRNTFGLPSTTVMTRKMIKRTPITVKHVEVVNSCLDQLDQFNNQKIKDVDRYKLIDPRSQEERDTELLTLHALKKAYKAMRARKRKEREARRAARAAEAAANGGDATILSEMETEEDEDEDDFELDDEEEEEEVVDEVLEHDKLIFNSKKNEESDLFINLEGLQSCLIDVVNHFLTIEEVESLLEQSRKSMDISNLDDQKGNITFDDFRRIAAELRASHLSTSKEGGFSEQCKEEISHGIKNEGISAITGSFWKSKVAKDYEHLPSEKRMGDLQYASQEDIPKPAISQESIPSKDRQEEPEESESDLPEDNTIASGSTTTTTLVGEGNQDPYRGNKRINIPGDNNAHSTPASTDIQSSLGKAVGSSANAVRQIKRNTIKNASSSAIATSAASEVGNALATGYNGIYPLPVGIGRKSNNYEVSNEMMSSSKENLSVSVSQIDLNDRRNIITQKQSNGSILKYQYPLQLKNQGFETIRFAANLYDNNSNKLLSPTSKIGASTNQEEQYSLKLGGFSRGSLAPGITANFTLNILPFIKTNALSTTDSAEGESVLEESKNIIVDAYMKIDSEKEEFTIPIYGELNGDRSTIDHFQKEEKKSMFSFNADNMLEVPSTTDV